jgi:hypothetical protein
LRNFENWLNSTVHQSTGLTPYQTHFGKDRNIITTLVKFPPNSTIPNYKDLAKNSLLKKANERKQQNVTIRKESFEFKVSDKVWIKSNFFSSLADNEAKKLFPLYVGPYIVKKVLNWDTYVLEKEDGGERGIFCITELKRYSSPNPVIADSNAFWKDGEVVRVHLSHN